METKTTPNMEFTDWKDNGMFTGKVTCMTFGGFNMSRCEVVTVCLCSRKKHNPFSINTWVSNLGMWFLYWRIVCVFPKLYLGLLWCYFKPWLSMKFQLQSLPLYMFLSWFFFFFFKDQTAPEPANLFTLLGLTVYSDLIWYGQKDGSNNINMGVPAYLLQIICLFRDTYVKDLKFC